MPTTILALLAIAGYVASAATIGLRLFRRADAPRPSRPLSLGIGFLALLVHATLLVKGSYTDHGFDLGFFNALSLVGWTIAALLLFSSLGKPVENLGIALFPLTAIGILLELRFPASRLLSESAAWGLKFHVVISMLAYSLLSLASVQALLLAIQEQHLHNRHPGGFIRALPPLQTMETLLFEMIGAGFALLSLSLTSGFLFLENMFAQHLAHKTLLSLASWVVFGVLLWGRLRFGWRGRTAIAWTLTGVLVLMLAYFGSKAVLELILQRQAI
jgi:ABC-type uncharacterized transport system permease subunit